jgi:hypothetical protein
VQYFDFRIKFERYSSDLLSLKSHNAAPRSTDDDDKPPVPRVRGTSHIAHITQFAPRFETLVITSATNRYYNTLGVECLVTTVTLGKKICISCMYLFTQALTNSTFRDIRNDEGEVVDAVVRHAF